MDSERNGRPRLEGAKVVTIGPGETLQTACRRMHEHDIGCLVVTDETRAVVGIVTERDVVRTIGQDAAGCRDLRAADVMIRDVVCCPADTPMREVQRLMGENGIRHMPLVKDGAAVGMVSVRDVIVWQMKQDKAMRDAAEQIARLWSSVRSVDADEVIRLATEGVPGVLGAGRSLLCFDERQDDGSWSWRIGRSGCPCPADELLPPGTVDEDDGRKLFDHRRPATCEEFGAGNGSLRLPLRLTWSDASADEQAVTNGYLCLCDLSDQDESASTLTEYKVSLLRDTLATNLSHAVLFNKYKAVQRAAFIDSLTGLATRQLLEEKLDEECARSARYHTPFSLAMIDVDRFKSINDSFGHAVGDELLGHAGRLMGIECRETDTLARYGGDEFVLLMPETNMEQAVPLLERIRTRIAGEQAPDRPAITISVGLVGYEADRVLAGSELLRRADRALYQAKRDGRNRVVCWSSLREVQEHAETNDAEEMGELRGPCSAKHATQGEAEQTGSPAMQAREAFVEGIAGLVKALDARDSFTHSHSENVACYAMGIARQMGIDPDQVQVIRRAALVHDLGMIGVPDAILRKPSPLTDEERAIVRRHPVTGLEILMSMSVLRGELPIVHQHHERWDGGGYPDQLAGTRICLGARIVAVADALDAITSVRNHRHARPLHEALETIQDRAGIQFDPNVVMGLLEWVRVAQGALEPGHGLTAEDLLASMRETALAA